MTAPTLCTKCGGPLTFPRTLDLAYAAKELGDATQFGEEPVRALIAVGVAKGLLNMVALCIEGVCVVCQPIGGEEPAPSIADAFAQLLAGRRLRVVRE